MKLVVSSIRMAVVLAVATGIVPDGLAQETETSSSLRGTFEHQVVVPNGAAAVDAKCGFPCKSHHHCHVYHGGCTKCKPHAPKGKRVCIFGADDESDDEEEVSVVADDAWVGW
jgi:hypothetical protein